MLLRFSSIQNQLPFIVTLEILDVEMEHGHAGHEDRRQQSKPTLSV